MQNNWRGTVKSLEFSSTTYEYSMWHLDELRIRSFLISSNRGMGGWFNTKWQAALDEADRLFDPDYHGEDLPYNLFIDSTGLDPESYFWQLSSAVIKDACGLYEVYLERAADGLVHKYGARLLNMTTENSWSWKECCAFYQAYLDFDVRPPLIDNIIWMRNKMAHLRDELRTSEGIAEFERRLQELAISNQATMDEAGLGLFDNPLYPRRGVEISQLQTYRVLDIIRSRVIALTLHLLPFFHGATSNIYLDALRSGSPKLVKDFDSKKLLARWPT